MANIDHLLIGPQGVFIVDAKKFQGRLTLDAGSLWNGGHLIKVSTTRWEAEEVGRHLSSCLDRKVPVWAVMCVMGALLPRLSMKLDGVRLVSGGGHLVREIRSYPQALGSDEVSLLAARSEAVFEPRTA
jgi:hypothetical protein